MQRAHSHRGACLRAAGSPRCGSEEKGKRQEVFFMNARFSRRLRRAPLLAALAFGVAVLFFEGGIHAQLSDKESVVTFKVPVEIPGSNPQVLPAGTYRFRIVDSKSEPHIVQISDQ